MSCSSDNTHNECIVCYDECGDYHKITCLKKSCPIRICSTCFGTTKDYSFLEMCEQDANMFPQCTLCNSFFDVNTIPKNLLPRLARLLARYLFNRNADTLREEFSYKNAQEKHIMLRMQFMKNEMPFGVYVTATKYLKAELKKIEKEYSKVLQERQRNKNEKITSNNMCKNATCPGTIDDNFMCETCLSTFCPECQELMNDALDHKCDENILATIKYMEKMIHCPKCMFPVEKSSGCNNMTCANVSCGVNFCYRTGQITGHGGHSKMIEVKTFFNLTDLFDEYAGTYTALIEEKRKEPHGDALPDENKIQETLQRIESLLIEFQKKAPNTSDQPVIQYLNKHYEFYLQYTNNDDLEIGSNSDAEKKFQKIANKILQLYHSYSQSLIINRDYTAEKISIEQKMKENRLSVKSLERSVRKFQ